MAVLPSPNQVAGMHTAFYEALYQQVDPAGTDRVGAMEAATFLKKSRLSDNILSKIWDLSDPNGKGFLDKRGFFVALKLVALAQNGKDISIANINLLVPPPSMGDSTHSSGRMSPAIDWTIKPFELNKYDEMFRSLGPTDNRIPGNVVKPIMLNSKLPVDALGKIWELSDMDQDGFLDRDEFILAMHLVTKALEGVPPPAILPNELLPASKRKKSIVGGVPVLPDLLPGLDGSILGQTRRSSTPTVGLDVTLKNALNKVAPAVPWVVSAAEKANSDELFVRLDTDQDGYVSGLEIKDTLIQTGLPPQVLAHIWNLCDVRQNGQLSSEQFALAMHLISNKLQGMELPQQLTPEMIPPTLRPKPQSESLGLAGITLNDTTNTTAPQTGSKELDSLTCEIKELQKEKTTYEEDVGSKEAEITSKSNEILNLQKEQETLTSMLKQLELQKSEAKKRLSDLESQQGGIDSTLAELKKQYEEESTQVENLKKKVDDQKKSLETQETELNVKRDELNELRKEEHSLEEQIKSGQNQLDSISKSLQDTQLQISQAKAKINQLQELQRQMNDGIVTFDTAITNGDASSVSDLSLRAITPFSELEYHNFSNTGASSPISNESAFSVIDTVEDFKEDPFKSKDPFGTTNGFDVDPFAGEDPFKSDPFKAEVVTSSGFESDPFASTFPATDAKADPFGGVDPFGSFPTAPVKSDPFDPFGDNSGKKELSQANDGFGGDPFGSDPFGPAAPPRPESPTPALPPKKSKAPPPRPAPPRAPGPPAKSGPTRAAPAPPPPPTAAAVAAAHDPFSEPNSTLGHSGKGADPFAPFFNEGVNSGISSVENVDPFDDPFASKGVSDPFAAATGADPFVSKTGADPFVSKTGADPFVSKTGADPFASKTGADPFASKTGADPFASKTGADPFAVSTGSTVNDSFANFADFEKFSPLPAYFPRENIQPATEKSKAFAEDQQLAWVTQESFQLEQERLQRQAKQEQDDLELAIALSRADSKASETIGKKKSKKSRTGFFKSKMDGNL